MVWSWKWRSRLDVVAVGIPDWLGIGIGDRRVHRWWELVYGHQLQSAEHQPLKAQDGPEDVGNDVVVEQQDTEQEVKYAPADEGIEERDVPVEHGVSLVRERVEFEHGDNQAEEDGVDANNDGGEGMVYEVSYAPSKEQRSCKTIRRLEHDGRVYGAEDVRAAEVGWSQLTMSQVTVELCDRVHDVEDSRRAAPAARSKPLPSWRRQPRSSASRMRAVPAILGILIAYYIGRTAC